MTIQLKDSIFIAGVHQAAGTSLTLGADVEAELVNRAVAVYTSLVLTPQKGVVAPGRTASMRFGRAADPTGVASTTARTTQQAWRFPFDVYGFQLGIESNLAAATDFSLCKGAILGAGSETLTDALNAVGSMHLATPFNITWSGAAGDTVPARSALDTPAGIVWSDMIYKKINAGQVLATRMLWPYPGAAWAYPYSGTGQPYGDLISSDPDMAVMHWHDTTDRVTGWTSWAVTVANGTGNLSIQYIRLLTSRPVINVAAVGDSTVAGQVDSGTVPLAPVWAACDALSGPTLQFSPICRGWGGKQATEYYAYALDLIANYKPDVLFYQPWSQNDTDQADNTAEFALAMDVVSRCRAAGIVPILFTGIPVNAWASPGSDTAEAKRIELNSLVRNSGEIVCDLDAVLSDGSSPANYLAAYGETQHPSYVGYAGMIEEYKSALRFAVGW